MTARKRTDRRPTNSVPSVLGTRHPAGSAAAAHPSPIHSGDPRARRLARTGHAPNRVLHRRLHVHRVPRERWALAAVDVWNLRLRWKRSVEGGRARGSWPVPVVDGCRSQASFLSAAVERALRARPRDVRPPALRLPRARALDLRALFRGRRVAVPTAVSSPGFRGVPARLRVVPCALRAARLAREPSPLDR